MIANTHHRNLQQLHQPNFNGHGSGERLVEFLLSLIPTALMLGFLWGIGYLFYLLLLKEMP